MIMIRIFKTCFDLASILVRWINCSSVSGLSLLLGFPSAVGSKNYYAKSSPIFKFGHSEQIVKGVLGSNFRERKTK
jgi:hypothetical protein